MIHAPRLLAAALLLFTITSRAAEPALFEIRDGDRVLLMGDTLIEREGDYGYMETRMHEQFPDRKFIVRNLGFSADTPLGASRASFDPVAKGVEKIREQLALVKPTVAILGYGMAASLEEMTYRSGDPALNADVARYGTDHGVEKFKRDLATLMDLIEAAGNETAETQRRGEDGKTDDSTASSSPPRLRASAVQKVRFVLFSPIRHEDLRSIRPGLPDPSEHNKLLETYSKAIGELAKERGARFIPCNGVKPAVGKDPATSEIITAWMTDNGIHLNERGYRHLTWDFNSYLGWKVEAGGLARPDLHAAVLRKNALFFHRWRPANETYLLGFRKQEQGKNAAEILQFDPLIEAADAEIDRIKRTGAMEGAAPSAPKPAADGKAAGRLESASAPSQPAPQEHGRDSARPSNADTKAADVSPFPIPAFTLDKDLEISVFAENPLLEKPTQMNWDAHGRLWVASSSMYPMIAPGGEAIDKVLILEDTKHTGKADKSTVFADGLLLPTGVVADLGGRDEGGGMRDEGKNVASPKDGKQPAAGGKNPPSSLILHPSSLSSDACYVAASTQLLHFSKPNPQTGKATQRRIILSGFGTEDTHHILHTLHWGPDGRLYFHQSVYIHSHIETPWGVVRANAGAVFAYDPRTERVEVFCKGLWNSWGQQEDRWGQMFLSDGAGSTGVSWAFPGAVWNPSEGSRRQAPQISAGGFPKFAGLELIDSPAFPDDWQGNAVTCDFRAHRIVRFGINDLADTGNRKADTGKEEGKSANTENLSDIRYPLSGFATKEMPDVLRTSDVAFRPIDIRHGPDGALYVADWSNPVINHGEVDFRDPRRDHHHGRIWRITYKGRPVVKWEGLVEKTNAEIFDKITSNNRWEREQAAKLSADRTREVFRQLVATPKDDLDAMSLAVKKMRDLGDETEASWKRNSTVPAWLAILWASEGQNQILKPDIFPDDPVCLAAATRGSALYLNHVAPPSDQTLSMIPLEGRAPIMRAQVEKREKTVKLIENAAHHPNPRVRLEALRALARIPTARSAELVLDAAVNGGQARSLTSDPWLDFAAWQSINDLAKPWCDAVLSGAWKPEGREAQLEYALNAIDPFYSGPVIAALLKDRPIPRDGAGPWIELIGKGGSPAELRKLFDSVIGSQASSLTRPPGFQPDVASGQAGSLTSAARQRALNALIEAARVRNAKPDGDLAPVVNLFDEKSRDIRAAAARLAGLWHYTAAAPRLTELASLDDEGLRNAGFEGFLEMGFQQTVDELNKLVAADKPPAVRRGALVVMARHNPDGALAQMPAVLAGANEAEALETWRGLLKEGRFMEKLEKSVPADISAPALSAGLKVAREKGSQGAQLAKLIEAAGGKAAATPKNLAGEIAGMVKSVAQGGDPAQGELVYRRIGCVLCHSIGGAGGKLGPDLTSIGASAPMDYLVESVFDPAAKVKEGYHAFAFTMKDGSQMTGIPTHETATEQFIRPGPVPEMAVVKANIVKRENVGSLMPPGLADALSFVEKRSLFAFLGQLGKPGPFDASKGNVARVWWLYSAADFSKAVKAEKIDEAIPAYTQVDGQLVRELLQPNSDLVAKNGGEFYAVARVEAPNAMKNPIALTGAKEAWLDGKPLASVADIAAGAHVLTVKLDAKKLPDVLKAQCDGARFLGE